MSKINKPAQQATKFVKGNQAAPIKKVESESDELSDVPPPPKKNQQQKPIVGTDNKAKAVVKAPKVDSDEEDEPVKLVQQVKKSSFDATKPTTTNKNVAKPVQKKPVQPDSDEESDDAPTPPKKTVAPVKPAAKPAAQTKVAVKPQQESDEESDDAPPPKKPVVATKPAVGAKPAVQAKTKQAPKPDSDDEESDDAPPPKKPAVATKPAAKPAAKVPAKQESDEDEDSDVPPPPKKQVVPAKTAPVAKPAAKQPAQLPSSDDEESDDIPPPPKQAAKPAQQQKAPAKKIEVENDEDEDEDEDDVPPPPKKPQQQFQQKQQQPQQAQQGQQDHEVFVKGLSFDATEQDIKDFFTECGAINSVNLLKGPNGNSKGIAFVRFATEDAQTAAVEYSGSEHMGRTLAIEKTKPREQRAGQQGGAASGESTTCFIGNLSFYATEDSLYPIFEDCGKIKEVRIAKDQDGKSRGFGYVEFFDNASAQKGLSKTGTDVEGRAIRVDLANSTQRSGGDRGSRGGFGGRGGDRGGRGGFGGFGGRGGDRGGSRGRGGFGGRGRGGNLDANDIAAKKGTIAGFAGKRTAL